MNVLPAPVSGPEADPELLELELELEPHAASPIAAVVAQSATASGRCLVTSFSFGSIPGRTAERPLGAHVDDVGREACYLPVVRM
jgi:hypothetical protein